LPQKFFQLGDRRPLDRLAGDRTAEDVVGLVFRINGQLVSEAIEDVNVREDPSLPVLDHLLAFDVELVAVLLK
jgi:hypothetical protein